MTQDLYQAVTDRILASLESGVTPWVRPWKIDATQGGAAYNIISGKHYRGINAALLFEPKYESSGWLTYKQATDVGAHVRKGEKATLIVFYKPFRVEDRNALVSEGGERKTKTIPLLRAFHVFNVAQVDNLPAKFAPATDERTELERIEAADKLMAQATVHHGGNRAFYRIETDAIHLPPQAHFRSTSDYYATALHELAHWTGHTSRCAREYGKRFGDEAYAREELVAEMGAAFLCASAGIEYQTQHAAYIDSWIRCLKNDKRAIVVAASHAQKAADFALGVKFEAREEAAA